MEILYSTIAKFYQHIQGGLGISDIENIFFFISFIRFALLAFRYNLKTSFLITSVSVIAGLLWYVHLIKIIQLYQGYIIKDSNIRNLKSEILYLRRNFRSHGIEYKIPWFRPGLILYYGFSKGIMSNGHYIDPISMIISKLNTTQQAKILPIYYTIYNELIPLAFKTLGSLWRQLGELAIYTGITRIGRRYCPYLIRWHWTFLIVLMQLELIYFHFFHRLKFFHNKVILPKKAMVKLSELQDINHFNLQANITGWLLPLVVCSHLVFTVFGLLQAFSGQYFYIPFMVENTELHVGFRPRHSIYSKGNTPWQDKKISFVERLQITFSPIRLKFAVIISSIVLVIYLINLNR